MIPGNLSLRKFLQIGRVGWTPGDLMEGHEGDGQKEVEFHEVSQIRTKVIIVAELHRVPPLNCSIKDHPSVSIVVGRVIFLSQKFTFQGIPKDSPPLLQHGLGSWSSTANILRCFFSETKRTFQYLHKYSIELIWN